MLCPQIIFIHRIGNQFVLDLLPIQDSSSIRLLDIHIRLITKINFYISRKEKRLKATQF